MPVMLLATIVGSVLITWLLPIAFKSDPPYGVAVDIAVGTIAAVIWAYVAYEFISPAIGLENPGKLLLSVLDAYGLAAMTLWILRKIK
ncbi:MAG TPA: hypothetical protein VFI27_18925 [candidate division Zixibacteria bacterium]|nr:hypothetical protein [candidate division Zixibacteria bacterium]